MEDTQNTQKDTNTNTDNIDESVPATGIENQDPAADDPAVDEEKKKEEQFVALILEYDKIHEQQVEQVKTILTCIADVQLISDKKRVMLEENLKLKMLRKYARFTDVEMCLRRLSEAAYRLLDVLDGRRSYDF